LEIAFLNGGERNVLDYAIANKTDVSRMPIGTLTLGVACIAAAGAYAAYPSCGYGYRPGYGVPSKVVIGTSPTPGGGTVTTIKGYGWK
jgi:hypothetical protein